MEDVPVGSQIELTFESAHSRSNPYLDVEMDAVFASATGETIRRPAFWDGGRVWRVRFSPTCAGDWTFHTVSDDVADPGLHGVGGTLRAVASPATAGPARHGFLTVREGDRHLSHSDGTPFFWLGDTHWRFAWERWDESNKLGWESQFRGTVDLRVRQGYTVYQTNLMSFGRGWDAWTCWEKDEPFRRLVPDYFRETVDPRMRYISDHGLVNAFAIGWYQAVDVDPEGLARFARYLVARYGAAPMVWTLGGEVAGYDAELREARLRGWKGVAEAIGASDDYGHPITAHLTNERPIADYYQNADWLSFTLNQLGHGDLEMSPQAYRNHLAAHPAKPIVEGESMYEGLTSVEPVARRTVTSAMVRQVAYRAMQSGCCGYTYGAQGCWNNSWDYGDFDTMWGTLPWFAGVELPAGEQMGHMRRFYESFRWWMMRPVTDVFTTTSGENALFYLPATTADPDRHTIVVYFGETYRHDAGGARLVGLTTDLYDLRWFDPRTGEWIKAAVAALAIDGKLDLPMAPLPGEDWLLVASAR